jgi:hypothetical protein
MHSQRGPAWCGAPPESSWHVAARPSQAALPRIVWAPWPESRWLVRLYSWWRSQRARHDTTHVSLSESFSFLAASVTERATLRRTHVVRFSLASSVWKEKSVASRPSLIWKIVTSSCPDAGRSHEGTPSRRPLLRLAMGKRWRFTLRDR